MFKKNSSPQPVLQEDAADSEPVLAQSEPVNDVERLRDILYGAHARSMEKRLMEIAADLEKTRSEWLASLNEKTSALASSSAAQLASSRRELSDRLDKQSTEQSAETRATQQSFGEKLDKQASDQTAQLRAAQKEIMERLEKQSLEQAAQTRAVQKELSDRVEKMYADFYTQTRALQKELTDRQEKSLEDFAAQIRNLTIETQQRDNALRQELLTLASSLDEKKTSRYDLSQMLVELGQRLKADNESLDKH